MKACEKADNQARKVAPATPRGEADERRAYWDCVHRGGPDRVTTRRVNGTPEAQVAASTGVVDRGEVTARSPVWLWELTICEQKPWIRESGPFEGYEACSAWAMSNKKETFGRHCGTEADMGEHWREQSFCP